VLNTAAVGDPVQAYNKDLRVPAIWGLQVTRQLAHEGGKIVSSRTRPVLTPRNIPGTHFC